MLLLLLQIIAFFKHSLSSNCPRGPKVSSWEPFSAFNVWYLAHLPTSFSLCSTSWCQFWGPDPAQAGSVFEVRIHGHAPNLQISSENFTGTRGGDLSPSHGKTTHLWDWSSREIFSSVLGSLKHTSISIHYSLTKLHVLLRLSTILHLFFPLLFSATLSKWLH